MARHTKQEAQATRARILDAAELLFERDGVARTSLHEIAQASGVTRGAVYWHFQNKADLFNAMMTRVTLPLEEGVHRSDDPALNDPLIYMRERFMDALKKTVSDPQTRRVFEIATHKVEYVGELTAVRDRHLAVRNECLMHVERGMRRAMRRGLVTRRLPARSAALGLHALIDGLIQNWMLDPKAFDLLKVGRQLLDAYIGSMTVGEAPA